MTRIRNVPLQGPEIEITRRLLWKKYHMSMALSEKIGYAVWNQMESKDIRDVINIAKLTNSSEDIDWLTEVQVKYGRKDKHDQQ